MNIKTKIFNLRKKRGFALTEVLLAIVIGFAIASAILVHFKNTKINERMENLSSKINELTELNYQMSVLGNSKTDTFDEENINISIKDGVASIKTSESSSCETLSSMLQSKGDVIDSSCGNNKTFKYETNDLVTSNQNKQDFSAGTPEKGVNTSINTADLTGSFNVNGIKVASGSTKSIFNSDGTTFSPVSALHGGNGGFLSAGVTVSAPAPSPATPVTGTSTMACSTFLSESQYQSVSLGSRATSCPSGQISVANQTGERTWACPNPNSASLPVGTDTWSGGACATLCVPQAAEYRTVACPTGQTGTETQQAISSCPSQTGTPVYGEWTTISTANCQTPSSTNLSFADLGITATCGIIDNNLDAGEGYSNDNGSNQQVTGTQIDPFNLSCSYSGHFLYKDQPSDPFKVSAMFSVTPLPAGATVSWSEPNCSNTLITFNNINMAVCSPSFTEISSSIMNAGGVSFKENASVTVTLADGRKSTMNYSSSYRIHGPN